MLEALGKIAAFPKRIVRNTSLVTRLSLVIVLVALVSLAITSVVGLQRGSDLADGVLRDRLEATGAAQATEVRLAVRNVELVVIGQAISPSTAEAIDAFAQAYRELDAVGPTSADEAAVDEYYVDVVAPELSEVRGRPISAASLLPEAPAAVYLQANYVAPNADDASLLNDAGDGSDWSAVHAELHQSFSEVAIRAKVDDLYLIEPTRYTIVYSTSKDPDFATSLLFGPQSGSALAALISSFGNDPEPGTAKIQDFTSYSAAGGAPSAFVASPVVIEGRLAGFVALRVGPERLNSITSNGGSWPDLGETGQTYVVAGDSLLRSDARRFVEDQRSYLDAVSAAGAASEEQVGLMRLLGTTVLLQPVDDATATAAIGDRPEVVETRNIFGTTVVQARRPLMIDGLDWAIVAEVERQEITQPIVDFARNLLIAIAVLLVGITFLAVRWSNRLLQPVRVISTNLRAVRARGDTDGGLDSTDIPAHAATEFAALAGDIDTMLATLAARDTAARTRADERQTLLRRLLPPQAAQRAEAGERDVIDQVANVTIAAVGIKGLGQLLQSGSRDDARDVLDRFVEEADALAKQRGLERVRLSGDAYVAGCGIVRPHIDHAARAVAFVLDVGELTRDLADDGGYPISISAGVDSGPVTVGLTGGSGLVYDAWGATVQRATELARRAAAGGITVSAACRALLPPTYQTEDWDVDDLGDFGGAGIVTGRTTESEPVR